MAARIALASQMEYKTWIIAIAVTDRASTIFVLDTIRTMDCLHVCLIEHDAVRGILCGIFPRDLYFIHRKPDSIVCYTIILDDFTNPTASTSNLQLFPLAPTHSQRHIISMMIPCNSSQLNPLIFLYTRRRDLLFSTAKCPVAWGATLPMQIQYLGHREQKLQGYWLYFQWRSFRVLKITIRVLRQGWASIVLIMHVLVDSSYVWVQLST
jgi:hypothetical protein